MFALHADVEACKLHTQWIKGAGGRGDSEETRGSCGWQ